MTRWCRAELVGARFLRGFARTRHDRGLVRTNREREVGPMSVHARSLMCSISMCSVVLGGLAASASGDFVFEPVDFSKAHNFRLQDLHSNFPEGIVELGFAFGMDVVSLFEKRGVIEQFFGKHPGIFREA